MLWGISLNETIPTKSCRCRNSRGRLGGVSRCSDAIIGNEALLSAKTFRSIISDYSHQQASNVTSHGPLGLSQPRSLIWMRWILVETTFFIRLFWLYTPQDHRMHCVVYLSTFTIEIQQMWANIPYIDHIGATCWFQILCCACYQCVRVCVVIRIDL